MLQNRLLAACLYSRDAYEEMRQLGAFKDFGDQQKVILDLVSTYFKNDPSAQYVDKEVIKDIVASKFADKHVDKLHGILDDLKEVSIPNVMGAVIENRLMRVKEELAAALLTPKDNADELAVLMAEFDALSRGDVDKKDGPTICVAKPVSEVLQRANSDAKIKLYPDVIQEATGGALRGHHILIFARPDCGKTTLGLNIAYGMLSQGLKTMYIINEDPVDDVNLRMLARLSHRTKAQVEADPEGTQRVVDRRNYDKFYLVEMSPGTPSEIERVVAEYRPDVLIVDQSRNVEYPKLSKVEALEQVERFIRNLGKKYDMLTVSFTQAGDSAEGKLNLNMGDVDFSNCLAPNTPVRMYDGSSKAVKDIQVGELVMGMDSTPRTVKAVGGGRQPMYRITHKNGDYYECNEEHILTLKKVTRDTVFQKYDKGEIVDMKLTDFMSKSSYPYHFKGITVGYSTGNKTPSMSPYLVGLWLSDGSTNKPLIVNTSEELKDYFEERWDVIPSHIQKRKGRKDCYTFNLGPQFKGGLEYLKILRNKKVPDEVFQYSLSDRKELLAGIIDGDGHNAGNYWEIALYGSTEFELGVKRLCTSLGLYCSVNKGRAYVTSSGEYTLPTVIGRKKAITGSVKDVMASPILVEELGEGDYAGITVDGDHRYVLANGIVTHNTGMQASADLMVGMGVNDDYEKTGKRMFTFPKNKLSGDKEPRQAFFDGRIGRISSKMAKRGGR